MMHVEVYLDKIDYVIAVDGNGNKGIEIRSNNDQSTYLVFSRDTSKD
jgi:hypothetical protein